MRDTTIDDRTQVAAQDAAPLTAPAGAPAVLLALPAPGDTSEASSWADYAGDPPPDTIYLGEWPSPPEPPPATYTAQDVAAAAAAAWRVASAQRPAVPEPPRGRHIVRYIAPEPWWLLLVAAAVVSLALGSVSGFMIGLLAALIAWLLRPREA